MQLSSNSKCDRCHKPAPKATLKPNWKRNNIGQFVVHGHICPACVQSLRDLKSRKWGVCHQCNAIIDNKEDPKALGRRKCIRCDARVCAKCRGEVVGGPKKLICLKCNETKEKKPAELYLTFGDITTGHKASDRVKCKACGNDIRLNHFAGMIAGDYYCYSLPCMMAMSDRLGDKK